MLLSPESDVTTPTRLLRDFLVFSDILLPLLLLSLDCFAASNIAAQFSYASWVFYLSCSFANVEIQKLFIPQTIGSTTGGLVLYCACAMKRQPACMLFSKPIDSLAAAGAVLADVWVDDVTMPVIDSLGDDFLEYVKDGMTITVDLDGTVTVED